MTLKEAFQAGRYFKRKAHGFYFSADDIMYADNTFYLSEFASSFITTADLFEDDWQVMDSVKGLPSFKEQYASFIAPASFKAWQRRQKHSWGC